MMMMRRVGLLYTTPYNLITLPSFKHNQQPFGKVSCVNCLFFCGGGIFLWHCHCQQVCLSVCRTDLSVSDVDILFQLTSAEHIRM